MAATETIERADSEEIPKIEEPPPSVPPIPPPFHFQFHNRYDGIFTNKHERFMLREEHIAELQRLVIENNRERHVTGEPLCISDIITACLDFAFEHPRAFSVPIAPKDLREVLGREVYRKAFLHFMRHEMV